MEAVFVDSARTRERKEREQQQKKHPSPRELALARVQEKFRLASKQSEMLVMNNALEEMDSSDLSSRSNTSNTSTSSASATIPPSSSSSLSSQWFAWLERQRHIPHPSMTAPFPDNVQRAVSHDFLGSDEGNGRGWGGGGGTWKRNVMKMFSSPAHFVSQATKALLHNPFEENIHEENGNRSSSVRHLRPLNFCGKGSWLNGMIVVLLLCAAVAWQRVLSNYLHDFSRGDVEETLRTYVMTAVVSLLVTFAGNVRLMTAFNLVAFVLVGPVLHVFQVGVGSITKWDMKSIIEYSATSAIIASLLAYHTDVARSRSAFSMTWLSSAPDILAVDDRDTKKLSDDVEAHIKEATDRDDYDTSRAIFSYILLSWTLTVSFLASYAFLLSLTDVRLTWWPFFASLACSFRFPTHISMLGRVIAFSLLASSLGLSGGDVVVWADKR